MLKRFGLSLILCLFCSQAFAQWPQFVQDAHDEASTAWQAAAFVSVEIIPDAIREAEDAHEAAVAQRALCTDPAALAEGDSVAEEGADAFFDADLNKVDGRGWHDDAQTLHLQATAAANAGNFAIAVEKWQESKANSENAKDALELAESQYGIAAQKWCEAEAIFWSGTPGGGPGENPPE